MAIVQQPLFGVGLQGKSPKVTAGSLVNAYYEFQSEPDGTRVVIYGTPGLDLFHDVDAGDTPWRGLHPMPDVSLFYGVHRGTFYEVNNSGVVTARGTIGTTSGMVDIVDDGTNVIVVDGSEIYTYNTTTPATPIAAGADAERPTAPNTCTVQAGRTLTDENGTGQFKGSSAYAPGTWDALDFATAESNPDDVIRVLNHSGTVLLMGVYSIEPWANVGGSGFPYAKIINSDSGTGLAARWSVGKILGTYAFLAQNREGEVFVGILNGYRVERISNFELDYIINGYSSVANATGYGYLLGGHPMYQINFPSVGKSWLYDATTKYWSEVRSGADGRHRGEIAIDFINQTIVSDYENGKLYKINPESYTDNGAAIHTILRGRHIVSRKKMVKLSSIELGIESGVGTVSGQGSDPVAALRLSKDGGHSFGVSRFSKMGKVGEYTKRLIWRRCGIGRDIVPEITITDPVKRVITEAVLNISEGL
jgi:hypothetical protein